MPPSIIDLMRALPEVDDAAEETPESFLAAALRPVPVGRWRSTAP